MASFLGNLMKGDATAVKRRKFSEGTKRYHLYRQAHETLRAGVGLKEGVRKPQEESFEDWLAVHVVDFLNRLTLLYGTVCEVCTDESCPVMSGGSRFEYLWQDGVEFKKPTALSAPDYIESLFDWVNKQVSDEKIFPTKTDVDFPNNFKRVCQKILSRLFRVFVHVYIHHFDRLKAIGAEAHCNTLFKHFYYFVKEFNILEEKDFAPLADLIDKICRD